MEYVSKKLNTDQKVGCRKLIIIPQNIEATDFKNYWQQLVAETFFFVCAM